MDFEKTSFSVDWFTPGDKSAPKRLSFPKSARISIDDLVSDSSLGFCFNPVDEAIPQPRSSSFVDTPFERAFGWSNSAPPSPFVSSDHERCPVYDRDLKPREDTCTDWRAPVSPGLLSVVDDFALCGVDLDVSCLDTLDEQLLSSPLESFTELCWAVAVYDEDAVPAIPPRQITRPRSHSLKRGYEPTFSSSPEKAYPGSFERTRPLAAKVTLPLETFPHYLSYPSKLRDTSPMRQDESLDCILYNDFEEHRPTQGMDHPRRLKNGDVALTPSFGSIPQSSLSKSFTPQPPKSSHTFRVFSDAYSTLARAGRKSRY